jgi:anti-sigma factor RsiW
MSVEQFVERLCELELDPQQLREDPSGERWLPGSLRRMVAEDPACARELAEFVEMEIALHQVHEPSDAFFTRAVMVRLPAVEAVDDRRRTWILASAYALSIGVAYVLLGPLLGSFGGGVSGGELAAWMEPLHDWYHDHAVEAGGMWMIAALLLVAGALVVLPAGGRRSVDA